MRRLTSLCLTVLVVMSSALFIGCADLSSDRISSSGVHEAAAAVTTQANGLTQEQENVKHRIEMENVPGGIQHLYILSAYSGQVLYYSTVKGKVTSSGKRLSPSSQVVQLDATSDIKYYPELLGDDGTYGSSIEYLYWWDAQGRYHQQYVTGGMFIHISDQPTQFGRVTMQMETKEVQQ